jgi:hypothetical protein
MFFGRCARQLSAWPRLRGINASNCLPRETFEQKYSDHQILNRWFALHGFGYRPQAIQVTSARIEDGANYFPAVWTGAGLFGLVETKDFPGEFLAGTDF